MRALVVANWKMNPATMRQARALFEATRRAGEKAKHVSLVVAPPAVFLRELKSRYAGRKITFAIQHARAEALGAYTGDISLVQAADAGASYAIIGHAERRAAGETNDDTRAKVTEALRLGLTPILCVGESKRDPGGAHFSLMREQLRTGCWDVQSFELKKLVIVYEPLWSIGQDAAMSPRDMHEMAIFIRKSLVEMKNEQAMNVKILYGGSVDETNAGGMLRQGDVHGLLVGRASEDAGKIASLLHAVEAA
ncbi:MAG: hypothetical protein RLZZ416_19 [Candidatus Parcubacteria bacterium]|jgi:triosephosphate isomerase